MTMSLQDSWRRANDSHELLALLAPLDQPRIWKSRKLRLWVCACLRLSWTNLSVTTRDLLESMESLLAHPCLSEENRRTLNTLSSFAEVLDLESPTLSLLPALLDRALLWAFRNQPAQAHSLMVMGYLNYLSPAARYVRLGQHATLLRHLIGDPFVAPLELTPAQKSWHGGTLAVLVRDILHEHQVHLLPVLADALEDAGLTDSRALEHCRDPLAHPPGCWLLDQLMTIFQSP
jgi:hypothetical protein